tara:strand:- start:234 stop:446 length:213 start_codon:yes stop_codon:yes gene_type:complete
MDSFITDIIWILLAQSFCALLIICAGAFFFYRLQYMGKLNLDPTNVFKKPQTALEEYEKRQEQLKTPRYG